MLLALSGIHPRDRFTWILEVTPIVLAVPVLVATHRRFPLTPLAYRLVFVGALTAQLALSRAHDRQIARLAAEAAPL